MAHMGDVLAGIHSTWEFTTDSVLIRFERGIRTPKLFQVLGERRIPYEALSTVELAPGGKRGTVVLRAVPREGADPLLEAAAGQLKESSDPYRLVLPAEREPLADRYAAELRAALPPEAAKPAQDHLVAAPSAPQSFKAYDGKASFDGTGVGFRWFWTGASTAKWKAGDQYFPVGELEGVEWNSPEGPGGHLRLRPRGAEILAEADQDPASVVFGLGYGPVYESLPFAASVLEAVRAAGPVRGTEGICSAPAPQPSRSDPADVAERIRHLGELHDAGLLTDHEFTAKKAELLAEL
ncbi:Short C-terminal domain-containing protein [Streptomyces qinglanensis]|uniref:Short C-terminal domain-containing protein n=2 Tax=Streptomyces qinglanensis TaxID=943816 RepID=A0A1H9NWY8_9ACTN|nr:Short C-terminal domain-containing protein [Streptomyces qinglanensis]